MSKNDKKKHSNRQGNIQFLIKKYFDQHPNEVASHKHVCDELAIKDQVLRKSAFLQLEKLKESGFLKQVGHGIYKRSQELKFYEGELQVTSRGSGYVIVEGLESDIFIHPKNIGKAINGDIVEVFLNSRSTPKHLEGEISKVINRQRTRFVGNIVKHKDHYVFISSDSKNSISIDIPKEKLNGASLNDKVIVKMTAWPKNSRRPFGEVEELLQSHTANDTEMISILVNNGINFKFPDNVIAEAERITIDLDPNEVAKRKDFRDKMTLTIDPKDAKDFDDALSYYKLPNNHFEIGVHIADVSHYVQPNSAMDNEALYRSNSVYLVDRVVPMLPEQLSNIACSLRPNEDKFCFSAVFEIDDKGKIYHHWIGKTVICSNRRMTYEEAQEVIEGKEDKNQEEILFLDKIAKIYRKKRLSHGAIDFASEEIRFELDTQGNPIGTLIKISKDANKLIEEFMLLANRTVAEYIGDRPKQEPIIPFIYRVHDKPEVEKIGFFQMFIEKFGYRLENSKPDNLATSINQLLNEIRHKNEADIIQQMAIRTMSKAAYDVHNIGHYGLGFKYYTHFTSPIRRYADLMVHRIIYQELNKLPHKYDGKLEEISKRISRNERKAIDAERASDKYFQTLFMKDKVGEEFEGIVSGITDFGMFVELIETHCEGMIALPELKGDRFYYDDAKFRIIGARTEEEFNFGDKITVRVKNVDTIKKQIDLDLVGRIK